jgi:hypothetical protein
MPSVRIVSISKNVEGISTKFAAATLKSLELYWPNRISVSHDAEICFLQKGLII